MTGPVDLDDVVRNHIADGDERSLGVALGVLDTGRPMWSRDEFVPGHFTASGFVVSPDGSSLLLIHHGRLHRWLQPGGHIEADDHSVADAARREVIEETGVTRLERVGEGLLCIDAHPMPVRADEPGHVHIDLAIGFRALVPDLGPLDEVLDARWVRFDQLDTYDVDAAVIQGTRRLLGAMDR
jgi:8-oxo-dGTP pyrophosphatase MutT (NUDIX family)